jgi:hypothetical protein
MADRDTQFAGFAQALYDEMTMNVILSENRHDADVLRQEQLRIMARRAYDLACHTVGSLDNDIGWLMCKGYTPSQIVEHDVSDLTEWPEKDESKHGDTPQS